MNVAKEIRDLTETHAMPSTTAKVSITPEDENSKSSQKSDKRVIEKEFWRQWQEIREQLYRYCLRLMKSNHADAEDALSQAMLKAREKALKFAGKIENFKAWLMTLTRNLCIDIFRKRSRSAVGVEDIEWVGDSGDMGVASAVESPETVLEREERSVAIRRAISSLPEKMRETYILHFYDELTYPEIVERQGISYDCLYKGVSQAKKKLTQMLRGYFLDSEVGVSGNGLDLADANGWRQKMEVSDNESARGSSLTPAESMEEHSREEPEAEVSIGNEMATVRTETEELHLQKSEIKSIKKEKLSVLSPSCLFSVESRERVEVKIPEAVTVSAEADVDVAECLESVEVVGEEISDVVGVCAENELLPILPGVLSLSSLDLTWRRDVGSFALLSEWGREMLAAFLIGDVIGPEMSEGHKGAVGNWWRNSVGRLSSILDMVGVVIRKFFNVPDSSWSLPRFQVKGKVDGERPRLVDMVGAIDFKHPRQAELHLLKARDFVDCGGFVAYYDTG